ncbi:MAG TPA: diguanylate cyclase [Bacillus sp. (in: firmicutes)]|nr:diguanylate cyclase [Bacillus sp. (in: firmicutes)]
MKPVRLSVQFLILTLLAFAMIGTFAGSVLSGVIVSKNNLEKNYLIENQFYAEKLANTTDSLFRDMFKYLTTESQDNEFLSGDAKGIHNQLNHMLQSTTFFNSTWFVNETGHVVASAPEKNLNGTKLNSIGAKEALKRKTPLISQPYIGVTGDLIVLVSVPVFDGNATYKGFLAGTIHLQEDNSLRRILGRHPKHENNSYVFVVDSKGNIIYHPETNRINDNVKNNRVVQQVMKGKSGSQEVMNTKGVRLLAGYASSTSTSHWGIISQTPKKSVLQPTIDMAKQVSLIAVLFMMFVFILSFIMLKKIVNPIRNLAVYAQQLTQKQSVPIPHIPDWYFELKELKRAILVALDFYQKKLNHVESESKIDPLTGYYNRRSLEKTVNDLDMYSILLYDIDHFKSVNDQYGHQVGDRVLQYLSRLIAKETRKSDLCFRLGGEEFLIILPNTDINIAQSIAERIRKKTETTISPIGDPITISIGIASSPKMATDFSTLLNIADQALYQAKREGRNRVVTADVINSRTS